MVCSEPVRCDSACVASEKCRVAVILNCSNDYFQIFRILPCKNNQLRCYAYTYVCVRLLRRLFGSINVCAASLHIYIDVYLPSHFKMPYDRFNSTVFESSADAQRMQSRRLKHAAMKSRFNKTYNQRLKFRAPGLAT